MRHCLVAHHTLSIPNGRASQCLLAHHTPYVPVLFCVTHLEDCRTPEEDTAAVDAQADVAPHVQDDFDLEEGTLQDLDVKDNPDFLVGDLPCRQAKAQEMSPANGDGGCGLDLYRRSCRNASQVRR